jgi:hypothetical protein
MSRDYDDLGLPMQKTALLKCLIGQNTYVSDIFHAKAE